MISITLNGKPREIEPPPSIAAMLEALEVNPKQVAVAVNGEVVRRTEWAEVTVREGDAVEIVRAVGGGAGLSPTSGPPRSFARVRLSADLPLRMTLKGPRCE